MISRSKKFIFIHIPKCAGTSIESAITKYTEPNSFGYDKRIGGHVQHSVCRELVDLNLLSEIECKDYFKFTIVRNPWDRCVSEYIWRIKRYGNFVNGPINVNNGISHPKYTKEWVRENVSFEDFLTRNFPWEELSFQQHMKPQIEYCYDCEGNELNYIGRFENLKNDFGHICEVGIGENLSLPHKFKTNHTHYTDYYNKRTIDIVGGMYDEDIKFLGYEFGK